MDEEEFKRDMEELTNLFSMNFIMEDEFEERKKALAEKFGKDSAVIVQLNPNNDAQLSPEMLELKNQLEAQTPVKIVNGKITDASIGSTMSERIAGWQKFVDSLEAQGVLRGSIFSAGHPGNPDGQYWGWSKGTEIELPQAQRLKIINMFSTNNGGEISLMRSGEPVRFHLTFDPTYQISSKCPTLSAICERNGSVTEVYTFWKCNHCIIMAVLKKNDSTSLASALSTANYFHKCGY
eukprot:TRINITY_DN10324_c0_g1_i2.p2 TRINITY_DN10324_c0_g1~~TRINITY_DN10324_c0_g1_i2.p2  ORF type:complete len:237 (+),score=41.56 TRINITY_DN10324_c0_g1_i2:60-770(+)